ncbi:hypothetical protein PVAG01_11418 [Phlyctema vagabunda]|uniref:DUF2428 domain-containing protein n=1 Tax=Phlyctema vagabunda TaxID=108571 RepID=A0ABR4P288_9HELO
MTDSCRQTLEEDATNFEECPKDEKLIVKWLESQPIGQARLAREHFNHFLAQAAQPRHASGNACIKLCYFLEQCKSSNSSPIRAVANSEKTCMDLFTFFIEWNEKNQNRSMRQVLELLAALISNNPDESVTIVTRSSILERLLSIIAHQASQPLVKPAFKCLECFLAKGTISAQDLGQSYKRITAPISKDSNFVAALPTESWDSFVSEVFDWMTLPDIAPAAGKFLVTLFKELKKSDVGNTAEHPQHTDLWQRWIRNGLSKDPGALENIKYYLFPPLFKLDRPGSLVFLEDLNKQKPISELSSLDLSAHSFLQLAALDAGKKAGLVEEPDTVQFSKAPKKVNKSIVLQEDAIGSVMTHASNSIRSLALSVLVSSSSSIRPFSPTVLDIMQKNLGILHADTDAKFRNEVLSSTKQFIERLRGAIASIVREIDSITTLLDKTPPENISAVEGEIIESSVQVDNLKLVEDGRNLLSKHERFIEWYLDFLSGELIPTCSYQRHITALKAITLFLRSGILEHSSGLKFAKVMDNSTVWPYTIKFFTSASMRLLLDLLMDPFEDVRNHATAVLKLASRDAFTLSPLPRRSSRHESTSRRTSTDKAYERKPRRRPSQAEMMEAFTKESKEHWNSRPLGLLMDFIARAEGLSKRTGRADYADGVARSYELLYGLMDTDESRIGLVDDLVAQLEKKVSIAEKDLARAVLVAPVHGQLAALNFVWEVVDHAKVARRNSMDITTIEETCRTWDDLQWRILSACSRIWESIKDVLCNDSPEGHLPLELDDVDDIDTKDVLSYSFRATHESSNLMRTMISKIKSKWADGSPILPAGLFADIGNLTFNQLASLRHRGAFSTVSLTFARCCQLAQHQSPEEMAEMNLLEQWYQGALACIYEQSSTTRRSAGIPALLTGVLSANAKSPAFANVMEELKDIARQKVELSETDEANLPQVHAMNCVKEIFKSAALGKRAESHMTDCLQLAADSLTAEIWAIRNCGLLLLRSLIDCLFGTSESKIITEAGWDGRSIRLSYDKYPALPELLLKLLDTEVSGSAEVSVPTIGVVESVFPALDIIRRAGPPEAQRERIYSSVSTHLGSKVWHVRELAARTICTLMLHEEWLEVISELILSCDSSANRSHGVLLAVKFVLDRRLSLRLASKSDDLSQLLSALTPLLHRNSVIRNGHELLAAYFEVLNSLKRTLLSESTNSDYSNLQATVGDLLPQNPKLGCSEIVRDHSTPSNSSALLRIAVARRIVSLAALANDTHVAEVSLRASTSDTDTMLILLDSIPTAFRGKSSAHVLQGLCEIYASALQSSTSTEVRSVVLQDLAEILDDVSRTSDQVPAWTPGELGNLGALLQGSRDSPQLSNASIRISGSILLLDFLKLRKPSHHLEDPKTEEWTALETRFEAWGEMLSAAGDPMNDFETRFAAGAALSSFYDNKYNVEPSVALLPSLFALYDTLNDDDDEIRDQGAETVSFILGKSLVPLAAAKEFLEFLWGVQGASRYFAWNVICRITGNEDSASRIEFSHLIPAEMQLGVAMAEDDSLFVEEEQNLFIDEIREAKIWSGFLEKRLHSSWSGGIALLATWVIDGLEVLNTLVTKTDGPLGWTSKPSVFAQCMRIVICAKSLLRYQARYNASALSDEAADAPAKDQLFIQEETIDRIRDALDTLIFLSKENQVHESLLHEILGVPPLVLTSARGHKRAGHSRPSIAAPTRQNSQAMSN